MNVFLIGSKCYKPAAVSRHQLNLLVQKRTVQYNRNMNSEPGVILRGRPQIQITFM